jgi:uncharacterized protein (TIGR04222 family)
MSWPLVDITHMRGPEFLVWYATVIIATVATCRWAVRRQDRTAGLAPALVPISTNPIEVAYLRGGPNEVLRLLIVDLLRRGWLMIMDGNPQRLARSQPSGEDDACTTMERDVLSWFSGPRSVQETFGQGSVIRQIEAGCAQHRERLLAEELLASKSAMQAAWPVIVVGAVIIVGLGGLRLLTALQAGRPNVGILLVAGVAGLALLWSFSRPTRLTARGRDYIRRLREAFGRSDRQHDAMPNTEASHWTPLLVGVYGVGILAETPSHAYAGLFPKASKSGFEISTDGCASCGSSCGGCGGCGGCGD